MTMKHHWTERSTPDYLHRLGQDFVEQIEDAMESGDANQATVAKRLGVSEGRVSQVLNTPGNIRLGTMVEYARAVGRKLAVLTYDDGDSENQNGPIRPEIFAECWSLAGRPRDFFDLKEAAAAKTSHVTHYLIINRLPNIQHTSASGLASSYGSPWLEKPVTAHTHLTNCGGAVRIEING